MHFGSKQLAVRSWLALLILFWKIYYILWSWSLVFAHILIFTCNTRSESKGPAWIKDIKMHNIFEDFAMTLTFDRTLWFKTIALFFLIRQAIMSVHYSLSLRLIGQRERRIETRQWFNISLFWPWHLTQKICGWMSHGCNANSQKLST